MNESATYKEMLTWQRRRNIFIGDPIVFVHNGHSYKGYLTGFDFDATPLKLIVRYVNKMGFAKIASIVDSSLR
jgi:hypothetical protein